MKEVADNTAPAAPDSLVRENDTATGSMDNDASDEIVNPYGMPSTVAVMSATPAGWWRNAALKSSDKVVISVLSRSLSKRKVELRGSDRHYLAFHY